MCFMGTEALARPRLFPANYMWTLSAMHVLNSTSHVGAVGEILALCLSDRMQQASQVGDVETWVSGWTDLGGRVAAIARRQEDEGKRISAGESYQRASLYYQIAERLLPRDSDEDRRSALFTEAQNLFACFARLRQPVPISVVDIPYEDTSLLGYLIPAFGPGPHPCVVFLGGLEAAAEWMTARMLGIATRGVSCLVVDGPGYGSAIRFKNLRTRYDYEVVASAAVDYLETLNGIDSARLGVLGISLGGYYATRSAAKEKRFKAGIAWGAIWDYGAVLERRTQAQWDSNMPVAGPKGYAPWIFGVDTLEEAAVAARSFRLEGIAEEVECPYLIIHGSEDKQVYLEDAQALFDALGSEDKELRVIRAEEGGVEHCQWDNSIIAQQLIFDFFAEKLLD